MQRPENQAAELADAMSGSLRVARALVQAGRQVDLAGLDAEAGRLCAACLDLTPDQGRALRPLLQAVLADLEALALSMRDAAR